MPFTIKLLGADAISGAGTTALYTVPGSALGAIVNNVRLVNTGAAAVTVNLFFKPSGLSQVRILEKDKSIAAGDLLVVKPELTLAPSDRIELVTTGSPSIEYVVSGVEKS
jgi:hypothetical protein